MDLSLLSKKISHMNDYFSTNIEDLKLIDRLIE